jgi:hypothetical protein
MVGHAHGSEKVRRSEILSGNFARVNGEIALVELIARERSFEKAGRS